MTIIHDTDGRRRGQSVGEVSEAANRWYPVLIGSREDAETRKRKAVDDALQPSRRVAASKLMSSPTPPCLRASGVQASLDREQPPRGNVE
jgi:hypothetical protein